MHETGKQILSLMFRPGETICVSPNQFGYHSMQVEHAMNGPVVLIPTADSIAKRGLTFEDAIERVTPDKLLLCALNPIKGYRSDQNCTAYRNFLVEIDYGPIQDQIAYIKQLKMPYSAAIFSGNKSVHFLISLDQDLPSESVYRTFAEWILNIVTLADQNTKNPSRSIRLPGAFREPEKQQLLLEYRGPIKISELADWLRCHPGEKPQQKERVAVSSIPDFSRIRPWVCERLVRGIEPPERNRQWFAVAVEFALSGYDEDDTLEMLRVYFSEDRTFRTKEWETTIRSAFKWAYSRGERNGKESKP
jgi:hypothetical protein